MDDERQPFINREKYSDDGNDKKNNSKRRRVRRTIPASVQGLRLRALK
jgi:hypothetical protein